MTIYAEESKQENRDKQISWENAHNHCNVVIIKKDVVHSCYFINGDTVAERAQHAEALLVQIAEKITYLTFNAEEREAICDEGYAEFPHGSVCIVWSSPGGDMSFPDPEFDLEKVF